MRVSAVFLYISISLLKPNILPSFIFQFQKYFTNGSILNSEAFQPRPFSQSE